MNSRKSGSRRPGRPARPRTSLPDICAICGQVVLTTSLDLDHPFRYANDPDYVIAAHRESCHRIVTRMDERARIDLDVPAAPFVFILHRIQLAFEMHGVSRQAVRTLTRMESSLLGRDWNPWKHWPKEQHVKASEPNQLLLVTNFAGWSLRAAELTLKRLPQHGQASFQPRYVMLKKTLGDVKRNPSAVAELLMNYPDDELVSAGLNDRPSGLDSLGSLWDEMAKRVSSRERVGASQ